MNITSITLSVFEPFGEVETPSPPGLEMISGVGISGQAPVNYAFRRRENHATQRRMLVNRLDAGFSNPERGPR